MSKKGNETQLKITIFSICCKIISNGQKCFPLASYSSENNGYPTNNIEFRRIRQFSAFFKFGIIIYKYKLLENILREIMSKRLWTQEQNDILVYLKEIKKIQKWTSIAEIMETKYGVTGRNGKQCRERYHNHLKSTISKTIWTKQELVNLVELHRKFGNCWALIARELPGRTDNCAKNHFYSILRKGLKKFNYLLKMKLKRCRPFKAEIVFLLASKQSDVKESQFEPKRVTSILLDIASDQKDLESFSKEEILQIHKRITAVLKHCKESEPQLEKNGQGQLKKTISLVETHQRESINNFHSNLNDLISQEEMKLYIPPNIQLMEYFESENEVQSCLSVNNQFKRKLWLQDHIYM